MLPGDTRAIRRAGLRVLGVVALLAFVSLWVQLPGLIGSNGIWPAIPMLASAREQLGGVPFAEAPSLAWWGSTDAMLHGLCGAGCVASLALVIGLAPGPASLAAWLCYLSLCVAGGPFLSFQWDALLLEALILASITAPWRRVFMGPLDPPVPRLAVMAQRLLVFRLMFASGWVKLASNDPAWVPPRLDALAFHYETQPLPHAAAAWAHALPLGWHQLEAVLMFGIELLLPLLIFGPRPARLVACAGFCSLQLVIAATGNYGFFNLLTAALCLWLLDDRDAFLFRDILARWGGRVATPPAGRPVLRVHVLREAPAVALIAAGLLVFSRQLLPRTAVPDSVLPALNAVAPFRSINTYGLFAVMTTNRAEIVIEGSRDAVHWSAYAFRWKPGDPAGAPGWVQPHMPRLDWQMWFAALSDPRGNPWFERLLVQLLRGQPEVLALLEHDPFHGDPPRHVRARLWRYHLNSPAERRRTGLWWRREELGPYFPAVSLANP
jgi:hypothetical protein